jgi:acyl transferase domain-containing protein
MRFRSTGKWQETSNLFDIEGCLLIITAGVSIEQIAGTLTSVFTATFTKDHHDSLLRDPDNIPRYFTTGNGAAMLSNRISHFFDLRGASMTLDTACSSSLAALHLACQSIRIGESDTSIVAGANLILNPDMFIAMSSLGLDQFPRPLFCVQTKRFV